MLQVIIHRVVHSVIKLIEQTQETNLPSVSQTTKLTLTQFSALQTILSRNPTNTIQKPKCHSVDDIITEVQYSKHDKTYALKQSLSTHELSNNFPARRTTPRFLAAFDMSLKHQLRLRLPQVYADHLSPQVQHHQE